MPAMNTLQFRNRRPNIAGAARSYGAVVLNLMAVMGAWGREVI